ncbi:hypothetical protein ACFSJ3_14925 [Corallincola platygyrae]|uniref:Tetratricopeptide repeat protein n=1 Tax=Corallincola platygyrae TaxID=1193278 RepID=A0ABW4XSN1_9GAMM
MPLNMRKPLAAVTLTTLLTANAYGFSSDVSVQLPSLSVENFFQLNSQYQTKLSEDHMNKFATFLSATLLLTSQANASVYDELASAGYQADTATIETYVESSDRYLAAFAQYKLAIASLVAGDNEKSLANAKAAQIALEKIVAESPEDAEAWSLLSMVKGFQIGLDYAQAVNLGPESDKAARTALKLAPNNPRAHLASGLVAYHKPEQYGGSKTKAVEHFSQTIKLLAVEDTNTIDWGLTEAYIWRAQAYSALNQKQAAAGDLQEALVLSPNNGWVEEQLANLK